MDLLGVGQAFRACAWCATEFVVLRRPGRPRLYCRRSCRQRAYEHRHGFCHARTVRVLPGQHAGSRWTGSGYERGGFAVLSGRVHAMRTSVRPEGVRRETLCGALVRPSPGPHFEPRDPVSCRSCVVAVSRAPLRCGVSPSNELAMLRALIDEAVEGRIEPTAALSWLHANAPNSGRLDG